MAFPGDYTLLRKIPIDATAVTGSNNDFNGLITEAAFKLSKTFIFANTDNGGGDVRFSTDEAGSVQISISIIGWDTSGETCEVRFLADGVDSVSPTDLYIWGDNTGDSQPAVGAAFGRNSVWVNSELSSRSLAVDATGNAGTPTAVGGVTIGGASSLFSASTDFDGTDDVVNYGNVASISTNLTISAWINLDTYGEDVGGNLFGRIVRKGGNYDLLSVNDGTTTAGLAISTARSNSNILTLNTWHWIVATIDSLGNVEFYVDGVSAGSGSGSIGATNSDNLAIGNFDTTNTINRHTNGQIAELIIEQSVMVSDYQATTYSNQDDVAGFYLEPVAVGGGFQAAWAKNANTLINWYN